MNQHDQASEIHQATGAWETVFSDPPWNATSFLGAGVTTLAGLAAWAKVADARDAMLSGAIVNTSEVQPALHTALRAPRGSRIEVNGVNVVDDVARSQFIFPAIVDRSPLIVA